MKELFPEDGKKFSPTSEETKTVVKEQGNVEAWELLELTDTVQCVQLHYFYDLWSQCGRVLQDEQSRPTHRGADPALPQAEV